MRETISVYAPGHLDPYDSYGLIACELVRHLSASGIRVNAISMGNNLHENQDAEVARLVRQPVVTDTGGILLGYPTGFGSYGPLANMWPKIAVTMFESTKLPRDWVKVLNGMDAVVVPSTFCQEVFSTNGVTVPIHKIPLGVDPAYRPVERPTDGVFTFLTFLDRGRRKGGLEAFMAFASEFGEDPSVRLIMKSRDIKNGKRLEIDNSNVEVIHQDMTTEELSNLYANCHCLINPNMGEGFGLIPREFAATGGISLTTNWGGTSDDLGLWGWPLDYELVKADWSTHKNFRLQDLGYWAKPDIASAMKMMRKVVDNRAYYQKKAMEISYQVPKLYSWKEFARGVYKVWSEIAYAYA